MTILYLPAVIALGFKLLLLFYIRKSLTTSKASNTLLALLVLMTACKVIELIGYSYLENPSAALVFLRIYYVSLAMLLAFLLQLSLLTVFTDLNPKIEFSVFFIATIGCLMLLFSDSVIIGAQSNGYSVTRIAGPLYWLVPTYALVMLFASLAILIWGYLRADSQFRKIQTLYILIAVGLLALPILVAVVLMAFDFEINAAIILPIGVTCFLCIITHAIRNEKLFDIRIWFPFTSRYKLFLAINSEFMIFEDGHEMSVKERRLNHEKIFLLKALMDYKGQLNQKEIAEKMGISESSLSKKRKQYGI